MKLPVRISEKALEDMLNDLKKAYPNEGCGFLFGEESITRDITRIIRVENSKKENKRRRFEISPVDYMNAEKFALSNGLSLLGVYHSHPDHPAVPSEHDLRQAVPYFSYIIVSVKNGQPENITSWQLNDQGSFEEEEIINRHININRNLNKII